MSQLAADLAAARKLAVQEATAPKPRKRVVLTRADRKQIDRTVATLTPAGLAFVLACRTCDAVMTKDGSGGFVCQCSHVVFT